MKIDKYSRHQKGLKMNDLYPQVHKKKCACGCGKPLTGRRRRWATDACSKKAQEHYWIVVGHNAWIRRAVYNRDNGVCAKCKKNFMYGTWYADHIVAVCNGGGGCGLENFQTLCKKCHDKKTKKDISKAKSNLAKGRKRRFKKKIEKK